MLKDKPTAIANNLFFIQKHSFRYYSVKPLWAAKSLNQYADFFNVFC